MSNITLSTLHEYDNQQVFDFVVSHLRNQNSKSLVELFSRRSFCMYRNPQGLKCAIGCLISDEEYIPSMEGSTVLGLTQISDLPFPEIKTNILEKGFLLSDLQRIHDTVPVNKWEEEFKKTADKFGLRLS